MTVALWFLVVILILATAEMLWGVLFAVTVGLTEDVRDCFNYYQQKRKKK